VLDVSVGSNGEEEQRQRRLPRETIRYRRVRGKEREGKAERGSIHVFVRQKRNRE